MCILLLLSLHKYMTVRCQRNTVRNEKAEVSFTFLSLSSPSHHGHLHVSAVSFVFQTPCCLCKLNLTQICGQQLFRPIVHQRCSELQGMSLPASTLTFIAGYSIFPILSQPSLHQKKWKNCRGWHILGSSWSRLASIDLTCVRKFPVNPADAVTVFVVL